MDNVDMPPLAHKLIAKLRFSMRKWQALLDKTAVYHR